MLPHVAEELLPSIYRGAALSDLPPAAQLARVAVPTTILAWTGDPGHPLSTAQALAGILPHAELQVAATPQQVEDWPQLLARDVARRAG